MSNKELALSEVFTLSEALASSDYFTDAKDAKQAIVKVLAGQELGIGPIAAMTGIHIVLNKVTLSGNLMASLIKSSPKYNYKIPEHTDKICIVEFFEKGVSIGVSEFSIEDAKKAGIAGGDVWKKYPRNMLFNRAISNGAKWFCPDLFNGNSVYTPDELETKTPESQDFIVEIANDNANIIEQIKNASPPEKLTLMEQHKDDLGYTGEMTIAAITDWSNSQ